MLKKISFILVLLLIITLSACGRSGSEKSTSEEMAAAGLQAIKEETAIIDFELKDLDGNNIKLSSIKGKVVLLNFWATWCPPCRAEMPSMQKLYDKFKDKGLELLAVNLQEDLQVVKDFADNSGFTFPILLDSNGEVGGIYGARSIPTTYIIDKKGNVIAGAVGGKDWYSPEVIKFFEKLLAN